MPGLAGLLLLAVIAAPLTAGEPIRDLEAHLANDPGWQQATAEGRLGTLAGLLRNGRICQEQTTLLAPGLVLEHLAGAGDDPTSRLAAWADLRRAASDRKRLGGLLLADDLIAPEFQAVVEAQPGWLDGDLETRLELLRGLHRQQRWCSLGDALVADLLVERVRKAQAAAAAGARGAAGLAALGAVAEGDLLAWTPLVAGLERRLLAEHASEDPRLAADGQPRTALAHLSALAEAGSISPFLHADAALPFAARLLAGDAAFLAGDVSARRDRLRTLRNEGLLNALAEAPLQEFFLPPE